MKRIAVMLMLCLLVYTSVTGTGAVYHKSIRMNAGSVTYEEKNPKPEPEEVAARIKNSVSVKKSSISGDVYVENGPVQIKDNISQVRGDLYLNASVRLSGWQGIKGEVIRTKVSYQNHSYDRTKIPKDIVYNGDYSDRNNPVIDQSGEYRDFNVNRPIIIDARWQDIYLLIQNMSVNANIHIIGTHKVTMIVEDDLNISHRPVINTEASTDQLDFVIYKKSVRIQNYCMIRGNVYFEGETLYMHNGCTIYGMLYASKATVTLSKTELYGGIACEELVLKNNSYIQMN